MSTADRFKEWLESKPADAVVGLRTRPNCCPFANFLKEVHGATRPGVSATIYKLDVDREAEYQKMGGWVSDAVRKIDVSGARSSEVTAGEALELLYGAAQ